jgi:hypothetical protein
VLAQRGRSASSSVTSASGPSRFCDLSGRRHHMESLVGCDEADESSMPVWLLAGRGLPRASILRRNRLSAILVSSC